MIKNFKEGVSSTIKSQGFSEIFSMYFLKNTTFAHLALPISMRTGFCGEWNSISSSPYPLHYAYALSLVHAWSLCRSRPRLQVCNSTYLCHPVHPQGGSWLRRCTAFCRDHAIVDLCIRPVPEPGWDQRFIERILSKDMQNGSTITAQIML